MPLGPVRMPLPVMGVGAGRGALHAEQLLAHSTREVVVVDVVVEADVTPVAPHLVIGAPQEVMHESPFACLLAPAIVVVTVAVH